MIRCAKFPISVYFLWTGPLLVEEKDILAVGGGTVI